MNSTPSSPKSQEDLYSYPDKVVRAFKIESWTYGQTVSVRCPCPDHKDRKPSCSVTINYTEALVNCHKGCTQDSVVASAGLTMADLYRPTPDNNGNGKAKTIRYVYHNAAGEPVCRKNRFLPKGWSWEQMNGNGAWVKGRSKDKRLLYRLPELQRAIANDEPVYLPEGEKDVETLRSHNLIATTNGDGAGGTDKTAKWYPNYTAALKGAKVVILPDADQPGERRGQYIAKALRGVAKSIKILRVIDTPVDELPEDHGQDVTDWLNNGHTIDDLLRLAAECPEWQPPDTAPDKPTDKTGEPVFRIRSVTGEELRTLTIERPRPIWGDNIFTESGFQVLHGYPGEGKTWAGFQLASAIAKGEPAFGLPTTQTKAGILSLETPLHFCQERFAMIGDWPADLIIAAHPMIEGQLALENELCYLVLREWIDTNKIGFLVLDALSRIHDQCETLEGLGPVLRQIDRLRHETKCSLLLIHHSRKPSNNGHGDDDDLGALRGTGRLGSDPTSIIRLVKRHGRHELRFAKLNFSPPVDKIYLEWAGAGFAVTDKPPDPSEQKAARLDTLRAMLKKAGSAGLTLVEICEELEVSEVTARKYLKGDFGLTPSTNGPGAVWKS